MHLRYIKPIPIADEGKLKIKLPPDVALKGAAVWRNTLVGFFLDKLPFSLVHACALRHWGKLGLSDVLSNGNGFFFFKFTDSDRLNEALDGGPWYFGGRPIFLKRWSPGMNLSKDGCKLVPIWVHFHNVPLEFWTDEGLSHIASTVGKPLHADFMTSSLKRLNYARICIEINMDDSLPNAVDIELEDGGCMEIRIEYNWVPKKCSVCKEFGHLPNNCKKVTHRVWIPKASHHSTYSSAAGVFKPGFIPGLGVQDKFGPPPIVQHRSASSPAVTHVASSASVFSSTSNSFDPLILVDDPSSTAAGPPSEVVLVANLQSSAPLPDDPAVLDGPEGCSSALPDGDLSVPGYSSPVAVSVISSPSSSPSSTPLLARKLNMIDEVEMKLGRKKKDKKKIGSSGNSRGKSSKSSK